MLIKSRRNFLRQFGLGAVSLGSTMLLPKTAKAAAFLTQEDIKNQKVTILHTNDTHSRIEPFPMDGGRNQGLGGVARRAHVIEKIRKESPNNLLLDAGDMFQGTPYFNFFKGEVELKLMSEMKYDASTIGNHEFDGGLDNLKYQLQTHAKFPIINANYDFSDTIMKGVTLPYKIFTVGNMRIGVTGVGVELKSLVPQPLYLDTQYLDPIAKANEYAAILKNDYKCDYVICLSHLGYAYEHAQVSDMVLAKASQNIDLIIGGHTHTFLEKPTFVANQKGKAVGITQVGWAGIWLGRIDLLVEQSTKSICLQCNNTLLQ